MMLLAGEEKALKLTHTGKQRSLIYSNFMEASLPPLPLFET